MKYRTVAIAPSSVSSLIAAGLGGSVGAGSAGAVSAGEGEVVAVAVAVGTGLSLPPGRPLAEHAPRPIAAAIASRSHAAPRSRLILILEFPTLELRTLDLP
ncbi:hypothetical protein [Timonella senegalensis]|uniref:hypothetical protein n=1 Tax=Timonella senegalensis TaxID=1465825 RepID=UPI002FDD9AEB